MPRSGLTGAFSNKWMFGPGGSNITIDTQSCIYGVSGYSNLYSTPQSIIAKNLEINAILTPTYYSSEVAYATYKIICSGTLTLNANGSIDVRGGIPNGGVSVPVGGVTGGRGFALGGGGGFGCLGGSGSGGDGSALSSGSAGYSYSLTTNSNVCLGGSGGAGASNGQTAGAGGTASLNTRVNYLYQPSVYQDAIVYHNVVPPSTNVDYLLAYPICGGAGGGGSGGAANGGGAGGGVCYIAADKIVFNGGYIHADGQSVTTGANVGGGGGGGVVILVCSTIEFTTNGGFCTAVGGNGTNNGSDGTILVFSDDLVGSFSGSMTEATYNAAVASYKLNS